ncbi:MAG: hypothetical protein RLZ98_1603 [Pseudomonadota bacterium]|jgi:ornithine carbamoyltransferase
MNKYETAAVAGAPPVARAGIRHFLDLDRIEPALLRKLVDNAHAMKRAGRTIPKGLGVKDASSKTLMMIFEKPSTRTRVSFDVAMRQLGGQTIVLNNSDLQLGRGEAIDDTARVLSRYVDAIMLRANDHANLLELAANSGVPVINGLTDRSHPCQVVADLMTFEEFKGPVEGRKIAWVGDGNNVAASWIHASVLLGIDFHLACPVELAPEATLLAWARDKGRPITLTTDAVAAVSGADCVITDTWVSMGHTDGARRRKLFAPYAVTPKLMGHAAKDAIFMHCLPAYRGHEVSEEVIDGPQSVVFDEAENRLHAQKAILAWCLGAG